MSRKPSRPHSRTKRKAPKAPPSRKARSRAALPPASGPVTLAQAKALAQAQAPKGAATKAALVAATPGAVGVERKKLALRQAAEIRQRARDYKAVMQIMTARGVQGLGAQPAIPAAAPKAPRGGAKALAGPLRVLAEGDSWFDYPVLFKGGLIPRLESRLGIPILSLAKAGDEVRYMLGVEERLRLIDKLKHGCPTGGAWDVLLFSGGGNDIVGDPMALWVRDWNPGLPPADHLDGARIDAALAIVRAGYEDLIALRNQLSPSTRLVFHAYDFAIPDGRGICHLGPWLRPTFKLRGFPSRAEGFQVVRAMLLRFAAMLAGLAAKHSQVTFIDAQGTLDLHPGWWHNELHPNGNGFDLFVERFYQELKALYPTRVV